MKKTVKPSPFTAIFFGVAAGLCLIISVADFIKYTEFSIMSVILNLLVGGVFVYYLLKYLSQERISYDENSFTVGEKTYNYGDITNVTVDSEQLIRNISTLRIKVYIEEEEICSFTKDDKGGKDFIAVLKSNDVTVNIDV